MISAEDAENDMYVRERDDWPRWRWDSDALATPISTVSRAQGHLRRSATGSARIGLRAGIAY